jgi:hypothetical protein
MVWPLRLGTPCVYARSRSRVFDIISEFNPSPVTHSGDISLFARFGGRSNCRAFFWRLLRLDRPISDRANWIGGKNAARFSVPS